MRACPHCKEEIKDAAEICKWCHRDVSPAALVASDAPHPDTKKCQYCAEDIKWEATVCKHCQRDLTGVPGRTTVTVHPSPQWNKGIAAV